MHLSLVITLTSAQFGGQASETDLWCVAKNNAEDSSLQAAIDWACGPGGTDCAGIQQGGPCYDPSDIVKTASYVFNSYYLKNGPEDEACNFSNSAAVTSLNPSKASTFFLLYHQKYSLFFLVMENESLILKFGCFRLFSGQGTCKLPSR